MLKHLSERDFFKKSCSCYALALVCNDNNDRISIMSHIYNTVFQNNEILDMRYWILITTGSKFHLLEVY